MSLYKHLPSSQQLDDLVAALVVDGKTPVDVREKETRLFRCTWTEGCTRILQLINNRVSASGTISEGFANCIQKIDEIKAAVPWATVKRPEKNPALLIHESGHLATLPDEIAIIVPALPTPEGATLKMWRLKGDHYEEAAMAPGLTILFESVVFTATGGVPFIMLLLPMSKG